MNRICIAVLMTVMICASGCGPSEQEAKKPVAREAIDFTDKLLSVWDKRFKVSRAAYVRVLIREGADVNAKNKDNEGMTSLLLAIANYGTPIVTLLIEEGADVNAKNVYGMTPLMFAAYKSIPEIITPLIEAGADVHAKNQYDDNTPLHYAVGSSSPVVVTLLIEAGADVHAKNKEGWTPLLLATIGYTTPEISKSSRPQLPTSDYGWSHDCL